MSSLPIPFIHTSLDVAFFKILIRSKTVFRFLNSRRGFFRTFERTWALMTQPLYIDTVFDIVVDYRTKFVFFLQVCRVFSTTIVLIVSEQETIDYQYYLIAFQGDPPRHVTVFFLFCFCAFCPCLKRSSSKTAAKSLRQPWYCRCSTIFCLSFQPVRNYVSRTSLLFLFINPLSTTIGTRTHTAIVYCSPISEHNILILPLYRYTWYASFCALMVIFNGIVVCGGGNYESTACRGSLNEFVIVTIVLIIYLV